MSQQQQQQQQLSFTTPASSSTTTPKSSNDQSSLLPKACWIWDNKSRKEFILQSPFIGIFLFTLLGTAHYGAIRFAGDSLHSSAAPVYILIGVYIEHAVVILNGIFDWFTNRRGIVGLLHLMFWGPGYLLLVNDILQTFLASSPTSSSTSSSMQPYEIWSYIMFGLLSFSFIFDLRDGITVLRYFYNKQIKLKEE